MDHPFHVHTNPFQLLDANGVPERAWRDIVQIPAKSQRTIRMRFDDFTGLTVGDFRLTPPPGRWR